MFTTGKVVHASTQVPININLFRWMEYEYVPNYRTYDAMQVISLHKQMENKLLPLEYMVVPINLDRKECMKPKSKKRCINC
jgi:hypothetical protein